MSTEALLGQNVSLIYRFIEQAVTLRNETRHWEALNMLDIAASLIYRDPDKEKPLTELAEEIAYLRDEAVKIRSPSDEAMRDARTEYLNRCASTCFTEHLKNLRDYMQSVGYYTMMNKGWGMFDPSKGRISGDRASAGFGATVKRG